MSGGRSSPRQVGFAAASSTTVSASSSSSSISSASATRTPSFALPPDDRTTVFSPGTVPHRDQDSQQPERPSLRTDQLRQQDELRDRHSSSDGRGRVSGEFKVASTASSAGARDSHHTAGRRLSTAVDSSARFLSNGGGNSPSAGASSPALSSQREHAPEQPKRRKSKFGGKLRPKHQRQTAGSIDAVLRADETRALDMLDVLNMANSGLLSGGSAGGVGASGSLASSGDTTTASASAYSASATSASAATGPSGSGGTDSQRTARRRSRRLSVTTITEKSALRELEGWGYTLGSGATLGGHASSSSSTAKQEAPGPAEEWNNVKWLGSVSLAGRYYESYSEEIDSYTSYLLKRGDRPVESRYELKYINSIMEKKKKEQLAKEQELKELRAEKERAKELEQEVDIFSFLRNSAASNANHAEDSDEDDENDKEIDFFDFLRDVSAKKQEENKRNVLEEPTQLEGVAGTVTELVSTESTLACLTDRHQLFLAGSEKLPPCSFACQKNNFPANPTLAFRSSTLPRVDLFAGGCQHAAAVTTTGKFLVWGVFPSVSKRRELSEPTEYAIPNGEVVNLLACGNSFILIATKSHKLFSMGSTIHGQLGRAIPTSGGSRVDFLDSFGVVSLPSSGCPSNPFDTRDHIQAIACGGQHSLIATRDGLVYAWGSNDFGQTGVRSSKSVIRWPELVDSGLSAVSVRCGESHSLCLTASGQVYAWGSNEYGQVGVVRKNKKSFREPILVDGLSDVRFISCGTHTSAAVTRLGIVYIWGMLNGPNMTSHQLQPRRFDPFYDMGSFVAKASLGRSHLALLVDTGASDILKAVQQLVTGPVRYSQREVRDIFSETHRLPNHVLAGIQDRVQQSVYEDARKEGVASPYVTLDRCFLSFDFRGTGVDVLSPSRSFTITNVGDCKLSVSVELAGSDQRSVAPTAAYSFAFTPSKATLSQKKSLTVDVKLTCLKAPKEELTSVYSLTLERRNKKSTHQVVRVRYFVVLHVEPLATRESASSSSASGLPGGADQSAEKSIVHALSTYVPSSVLVRYAADHTPPSRPSMSSFEAAILFIDISGFTSLNERLAQLGAQGPEQVSRHINRYFGQLIKAVNRHGGDVLKFAGDALICQFGDEHGVRALQQLVVRALQCGIEIQTELAEYDSGEGFRLTLHLGVGAGRVNALHVGGENGCWEYLVVGDPLIQLKTAVDLSGPGEVVISPECWALVSSQCRGEPRQGDYLVHEVLQPLPLLPLDPPVPTPRMESALRCYIQKPVQAFLDSWQGSWLAELRDVTVLFVNLTGIKIRRGCDVDVAELQQVLCVMQRVIFDHEGMVRQFLADDKGTVLIAVFLAHEDSPVRGVKTALEIHQRLDELRVTNTVGVTTGKTFCGSVGSEARREYAMVGDIVNLSARLMVAAIKQQVGILCDRITMRACGQRFDFTTLKPIHVKGKADPIPIFIPRIRARRNTLAASAAGRSTHSIGVLACAEVDDDGSHPGSQAGSPSPAAELFSATTPGRSAAAATAPAESSAAPHPRQPALGSLASPLPRHVLLDGAAVDGVEHGIVGRAAEKRDLRQHLEKACERRRNAVVVFEGTVGIGKTCMARYCRAVAREAGARVYRGAADSIHTTVPFFAWQGVARALLADVVLAEGAIPPALGDLLPALRQLAGDQQQQEHLPLLNHLLELDPPLPESELTAGMSSRERTLHTGQLLLHLLRRQAEARDAPLLLSFDDMQWMDYSSLALVAEALRELPSLQLVLTSRPQAHRQPHFEEVLQHSRALHLTLAGLSAQETAQLLRLQLGLRRGAALPEELQRFVHDNSQGNPFFAEELLQGLLEAEAVEVREDGGACVVRGGSLAQYRLPDTVQGVVSSRISNLKPSPQMVLKVASVIGQEFTVATLRNVYPIEQEKSRLTAHLAALQRLQFINVHQPAGSLQRIYTFKSELIRESAYNRMLFSQRQQLHQTIAEHLEDNHVDNLAPIYPTLAHHWRQVLLSYDQKQLPSFDLVRKAVRYIVRSGEQASMHYAHREAHQWFTCGLEVVAGLPTPNKTVAKRLGINPDQMRHCMNIHVLGMRVHDLLGFAGDGLHCEKQCVRQESRTLLCDQHRVDDAQSANDVATAVDAVLLTPAHAVLDSEPARLEQPECSAKLLSGSTSDEEESDEDEVRDGARDGTAERDEQEQMQEKMQEHVG